MRNGGGRAQITQPHEPTNCYQLCSGQGCHTLLQHMVPRGLQSAGETNPDGRQTYSLFITVDEGIL